MNRWVNFRQIKDAVSIGVVLQHYRWKCLRRRGDRVQGRCPIHCGHRGDAFHADLRHNGFHCFCCQAHGSVLDLVAAMERCSLRQAALFLAEWFGAQLGVGLPEPCNCGEPKSELIREKERIAPLRFTLRPVDAGHHYLRERGINADTATQFGVGYYSGPGLMHGRVVIPIHDERGQLLAYAGRSIDSTDPKYKLPAGFGKSRVLFNLHRALAGGHDTVVIVEGFFDCLKVHQAGLPCVVALMGCYLSEEQEILLVGRFRNIALMLDGDRAGQYGSRLIADRLSGQCAVEIINLSMAQQPDRLTTAEIRQAVSATAAADILEIVK